MSSNVFLFDPTAPAPAQGQQQRRTLDNLKGKVAGFIDNSKANFNYLVDELGELLTSRYGVKSIIKHSKHVASIPASEEVMKDLTDRCHFVITGVGD